MERLFRRPARASELARTLYCGGGGRCGPAHAGLGPSPLAWRPGRLPHLHSRGPLRRGSWRSWSGVAGDLAQSRVWAPAGRRQPVRLPGDAGSRHLRRGGRRHRLVRGRASPHPASRPRARSRPTRARSASPLDPRCRPRRHRGHRRARVSFNPSAPRRSACSATSLQRSSARMSACSCRRPIARSMTATSPDISPPARSVSSASTGW